MAGFRTRCCKQVNTIEAKSSIKQKRTSKVNRDPVYPKSNGLAAGEVRAGFSGFRHQVSVLESALRPVRSDAAMCVESKRMPKA